MVVMVVVVVGECGCECVEYMSEWCRVDGVRVDISDYIS